MLASPVSRSRPRTASRRPVGLPDASSDATFLPDHPAPPSRDFAALLRRLPDAGKQAMTYRGDVGGPLCVLSKYSLLGAYPVEQRRPAGENQRDRAEIPFLEVVPDVGEHIGQVHGV